MKTILLAVLLAAAPALAQQYPGDDDSGYDSSDEAPPPPQDDSGYQSGYGDPAGYGDPSDYAPPPEGPTYDDFRGDSELAWNGEWIDTPEYGTVWRPTHVSDSWQPYMYGRWAWTTAGWAWVSDEPFGWAVYHYGRWAFGPVGWVWIPGRIWAPAWVAWRWGDGYAGWCPLGPRHHVYRQPAQWVFVENRHFLEPIRRHVMPRSLAQRLPAPRATSVGPRAGPPVRVVERVTGRTVRPLAVTDAPAPHAAQATGNSVGFYRPRTAPVPIVTPRAQQAAPMGPRPGAAGPRPIGQGPRPIQGPRPQQEPRSQQEPRPQQGPRPQQQGQGAQPRPQASPHSGSAAPKATERDESKSGQIVPHARER